MVHVERSNTILYCDRWAEAVAFYRDVLGLPVTFESDWFVELALGSETFVSVADASRSSIVAGEGAGLTLSWRVADVAELRTVLRRSGVPVGEIGTRWGSQVLDVFDPAGNRIEFWSDPFPR